MIPLKNLTLSAIAVTLLSFSGCMSPKYNYSPQATRVSMPELNVVSTAYVGDEMLKQGKFYEADAIVLSEPIKFGLFGAYTLLPGYFSKTGEDKTNDFYMPSAGKDGGAVVKGALSDPWKSVGLARNQNRIYVITVFNAAVGEEAKGVKRTKRLSLSDDSFHMPLVNAEVADIQRIFTEKSKPVGNFRAFTELHVRKRLPQPLQKPLRWSDFSKAIAVTSVSTVSFRGSPTVIANGFSVQLHGLPDAGCYSPPTNTESSRSRELRYALLSHGIAFRQRPQRLLRPSFPVFEWAGRGLAQALRI